MFCLYEYNYDRIKHLCLRSTYCENGEVKKFLENVKSAETQEYET